MPLRDDEIEVATVDLALDRATWAWLEKLVAATGAEPEQLIASILHDVRQDDEEAEAPARGRLH